MLKKGSTKSTDRHGIAALRKSRFMGIGVMRSIVLRIERIFNREKWISLQYFELASLINIYLMAVQLKDSRMKKNRLEHFVKTAFRTLGDYKWGISDRFRKMIAPGNGRKASTTSLQNGVELIYEELKILNHTYRRRLQWKHSISTAVTLIRDRFSRGLNP